MTDEPFGHRGHPTGPEERMTAKLAVRLARAIQYLHRDGFSQKEAVVFIAGLAYEKAMAKGETWNTPRHAVRAMEGVLTGHSLKEWGNAALLEVLFDIADLVADT